MLYRSSVAEWSKQQFFVLRSGRRRLDRCPAVARRRSKRPASPSMGSPQLYPRDDRDARAESIFLGCRSQDRWSQSGRTDRSQLKQNLSTTRRGQSRCSIQPSITAQQSARNDSLAASAGQNLRRSALFFSQRILRSGRRIYQRSFAQFFEHGRGKSVPSARNSSTNDEHIEVQDVDQARKQHSQGFAETPKDTPGVFVPLNRQIVN